MNENCGDQVGSSMESVISADFLGPASLAALKEEFATSQPFSHVVFRDLCARDTILKARQELINNVEAKFKETDLFKVYQTGDLANMDGLEPELAAKLPTLLEVRNAVYSQEFRTFVEQVTGLPAGTLIDKTDCSSNCYAQGCHLLCHDDVISTRRVSYIIYLTDPDDAWKAEDGGALELYPVHADGDPVTTPSRCVLPAFNTMALFTVQPGRSFHSVQEVFNPAKPRLSISGWYHGLTPPEGAEQATLAQLKAGAGAAGAGTQGEFEAFPALPHAVSQETARLSPQEREFLAQWINPLYLERGSVGSMVAHWEKSSCVQLHGFLRKEVAEPILDAMRQEDEQAHLGAGSVPAYSAGCGGGWAECGPCHKQRFLRYTPPADVASAAPTAGRLLHAACCDLFASEAFAKWLLGVTELAPRGMRSDVRRFRPGLDYTVATAGGTGAAVQLEATLCFVSASREDEAAAWGSDEVGGFQCYILADDEAAAAAETYRAEEEDDSMISCSAAFNTLNLILRDTSLMQFVKYVSAGAPGSRWDIAAAYTTDLANEEMADAET
eukprot:jgi/Ulvmu1/315/UM001_0319.1